ncbi:hypothetical protein SERLA73DRAFT_180282 [Serpula lacrymans var. lacrymans S7.3]|uniref:NF-kappa-B-activating protein C-terminal domain-containing protein n=1 Tax=Serpula lacrymans var. lacrymans (strain S7.3) TaxID=936435 RepID=F8PWE7_SERL3|nr:hypothetical protein SERLA73DRAFT_180282 [Serpula lacrymans var. lacrymans S7.3]
MATIHPSRMALISHPPNTTHSERRRGRSPSPRARGPDKRSRDYSDDYNRETKVERHAGSHKESNRKYDSDRRDRSRERDRSKGRDRSDRRRASPVYSDYKRPPTPDVGPAAPWHQQDNMYPNKREKDRPPHYNGGSYGGGGNDFIEGRRLAREAATAYIWPSSPKAAARGLSPSNNHKSRKRASRRTRSETFSTASSDDDETKRHRERKERKRARKEKEREERQERKERKRHRSSSRHRSYNDSEDGRDRRSSRRSRTKSKSRDVQSPARSRTPSPPKESDDEQWVEKPSTSAVVPSLTSQNNGAAPLAAATLSATQHDNEDSDDELGPQPLYKILASKKVDERAYGGALLRGEGSAMAAFLQDGTDQRIPRRGEIGLTSDEIASYEQVGYVMSGSRHRRMNAVRMRKENQVISAEEKRGILKLQREERERREAILREEFSELVSEKLKGPETRVK